MAVLTNGQKLVFRDPGMGWHLIAGQDGSLNINPIEVQDACKFTINKVSGAQGDDALHWGDTISLKSFYGKYVGTQSSGPLVANRDTVSSAEQWVLSGPYPAGSLVGDDHIIGLRSVENNLHMKRRVQEAYPTLLFPTGWVGEVPNPNVYWQVQIVDSPVMQHGATVAFVSRYGKFLAVGGDGRLHANGTTLDQSSKFTVVAFPLWGDRPFSSAQIPFNLRAANGKYLTHYGQDQITASGDSPPVEDHSFVLWGIGSGFDYRTSMNTGIKLGTMRGPNLRANEDGSLTGTYSFNDNKEVAWELQVLSGSGAEVNTVAQAQPVEQPATLLAEQPAAQATLAAQLDVGDLHLRLYTAESATDNHPEARLEVPEGFKILGGGAIVNWQVNGNLLTAAYPESERVWVARSKDHQVADPCTITAYAICARRKDGSPLPADAYLLKSQESASAQHPSTEVALPAGYVLVGGGAKVTFSGAGNLLTASLPGSGNSWVVASKDHLVACPATVTAYAIGIKDTYLAGAGLAVTRRQVTSAQAAHPTASVSVPGGYALVGGGAKINWMVNGNLLTASYPQDFSTWVVRGKDHAVSDPATATAWAIGVGPKA